MQEGLEHIYPNHSIVYSHSALLELLGSMQKKGLEEDYSQKPLQEEHAGGKTAEEITRAYLP